MSYCKGKALLPFIKKGNQTHTSEMQQAITNCNKAHLNRFTLNSDLGNWLKIMQEGGKKKRVPHTFP